MNIKMSRKIHAIGQGAFYTEKITAGNNTYNIVYDCGSISGNGSIIEKEIVNTFDEKDKITAIFISHFHEDHVNGIETLLTHYDVKYIFLPKLTDESKILLNYYGNNWRERIINNVRNGTTVIRVEIDQDENNQETPPQFSLNDDHHNSKEISSGTRITLNYNGKDIWQYVPFNLKHDEIIEKLNSRFSKEDIDILFGKSVRIDAEKFRDIKNKFNSAFKGHDKNANSMVVYSGALAQVDLMDISAPLPMYIGAHFYCNIPNNKTGCLYLGDFNLKGKGAEAIATKYNNYYNNIFMIQTPHHGSKYSFNKKFLKYFTDPRLFFISAGEKNRYSHPSGEVIGSIYKSHKYIIWVIEDEETSIEFIYYSV